MLDFLKKSLRNKLLVTLMAIGFLPFLTLLIYTIFLSQTKIVNNTIDEQYDRTQSTIKLMTDHISSLKNEVNFISLLDMMDDVLVDDIDKRVSRLLIQKSNDLDINNNFFIVNNKSVIIASSNINYLSKKFNIKNLFKNSNGEYIIKDILYIYSKIYASFDKKKLLGYLILEYKLENLDIYLTHKSSIHSYITDPHTNITIGGNTYFNLSFNKKQDSIIKYNHVIVYKKMSNILKNWYIVYAVDKDVALMFLYDFIKFMLYISVIIFIIIIYVSIKYSKGIIKPIEELTIITDDIIYNQNYSTQLTVSSEDEIATLTKSFNKMLKTTSNSLDKLAEENKLRLKRFVQLIEVFNTIIQTKSEDECIKTSIEQIEILTGKNDLSFEKSKFKTVDTAHISLKVTDFENNESLYFGSIGLGDKTFEDENEKKFFNSISAMISLQLDKIRLIKRTMSASRAKSAFISNMSHELRTPLNAIIGFTQFMITYEELTDDQQDTMANIESSAHYLLGMINEILDIAKIEAGKMEVHKENVKILELVTSSYNMLMPLANDKNLEFNLITNNFIDKEYKTDPKMFKQIIVNLLSNSIKFTQEGSVTLEIYNENKNIVLKVKDSGIGISKEDIKQLFNDFTQVENVMQKKHKGTGLGLSLSKKMANILGGNVSLESAGIGKGTTSTFYIKE